MDALIRIADFHGFQVDHTEKDYPTINEQYATSSYQTQHNMNPSLIARPENEADVSTAVKWARDNNLSVAVKSGGHQYSGASSTGGPNIQIDLTYSFKDFKVLEPTDPVANDRKMVFIGVSVTMQELNDHLKANKLFVPTGQCATVGVGGHGQTGGYGQLGRSFGLFGDNIRLIHIVDHDGVGQDVTRESEYGELFYAILGGSPGNFGIITHYIVEVFKADSYLGTVAGPGGFKGPHAIKAMFFYTHKLLVSLLTEVAKMGDDPNFPRGFDLCVTVYSRDTDPAERFNLPKDEETWKRVQDRISHVYKDKPAYREALQGDVPPYIILYAQWCPTSPDDKYDDKVDNWFKIFRDLKDPKSPLPFAEFDMDMANLTGQWLMQKPREFDLPYVKRTYATASATLSQGKWAETVANRIDLIYNPKHFSDGSRDGSEESERFARCKLSVQIQAFGGKESRFQANKDNGTSYSWRDSTVVQTLDCFHNPDEESKKYAQAWQAENDKVMLGPNGVFSEQDRRLLWGSWGDWNMADEKIWKCYYEDEDKYKRLGRARAKADPNGTFTANPFAVGAVKN